MNATSPGTIARTTVSWSVFLSILMILAGIVALAAPAAAGISVTVFVGWLLIFSGIAHLAFGWDMRTSGGVVWELLLGILYIVVGAYLLSHLGAAVAALTVFLGIYLFIEAILEFALSYRLRPLPGWGWLAFDGIVTMLLAILIWKAWSTPSAIGVLVGISMLFSGISRLALSLAARRLADKLP
jgi:uncharacterized membrane protein HdeD (DUF308 family)